MYLSDKQYEFGADIALLLHFLVNHPRVTKFTLGELQRTLLQQKDYLDRGLTQTMRSKHLKKLAMDINIWIDGNLCYDNKSLKFIGNFWESIRPENTWGGNWTFKDVVHFERSK